MAKTYTPAELAQAARAAGFTGPALQQAVAVALAESGGTSQQSKYPGEQSFGVTQINVPSHPGYDAAKLIADPVYAFKAMFDISNGGKNFKAWTTVSGNKKIGLAPGAYQKHMATAAEAVQAVGDAPTMSAASASTPAKPVDTSDAGLAAAYGGMAYLANIPELKAVLDWAAAETKKTGALPSQEAFTAKIQQTAWYKARSQEMISWAVKQRQDPIGTNTQIANKAASLKEQAIQAGFTLADDRARILAENTFKYQMSGEDTQRALLNEFHFTTATAPQGAAGALLSKLKQKAKSYFVPVSDQALTKWVDGIVHGSMSEDSFDAYIKAQAKSLFPSMGVAIDAGMDMKSYADPYVQLASNELGINPDSIDMMDPKWSKALMQIDPKTGERTSMNLDQWRTMLRTDPVYGWNNTINAENMAADFGTQLERAMGAIR